MALTTTAQLLLRLQQEVRDENSTTDTETRLLGRLNEAYLDLVAGGGILNDTIRGHQSPKPFIFSWAVSQTPLIFNTESPVTSLTATVNQGSTSLTLSSTYATSLAGWFIRVNNRHEAYRISAHTAGTAAVTLDGAYVEDNASAQSCEIFKLDYTIGSDILLPTNGLINYNQDAVVPLLPKSEADKTSVVRNAGQGFPTRAFIVKNDGVNKSVTIRFDAYTENPERFEFPYVPFPSLLVSGSVDPILPARHNVVLVDHAASLEYDLRDSDSAARYRARAVERFRVMKSEDRQFTAYNDPNFAKVIGWSQEMDSLKSFRVAGHPNRRT